MEENIKNLGKVCITPEGVWDVNKEYDRLSLVVTSDADTQRVLSYVSRQHVPKGNISIKNTEYWQLFTTELKLEDITIDENGNVKIGDVVIYQIPLGDALGEIVVNKIKEDLTNHIMTEIRSYMTSMVQELINSFSNQIGRLISNGIDIRNRVSGEINNRNSGGIGVGLTGVNLNENRNSGELDLNHNGNLQVGVNGNVNGQHILSGNVGFQDNRTTPVYHKLIVNTTPSTAKVTLNGIEAKDWDFVEGTTIFIVASMEGYVTKTQTVNALTEDTTINISLVAKPDVYTFSAQPLNNTIGASGGLISAVVVSLKNGVNNNYTYRTIDSDNIINSVTKNGNNLLIDVKQNNTTSVKNASVELTQDGSSDTLMILINQSGEENIPITPSDSYVFTVNKNTISFAAAGGTDNVTIVSTNNGSNVNYTVGTLPDWLTINNGVVTATANSGSSRNATITLTQNGSNNQLFINVSQAGASVEPSDPSDSYVFTANPNTINFNGAGTSNVTVTSTKNGSSIGYTASSANNWASFNNGVVTVLANDTPGSRSTTITLTQNESNNTITITVNQAAGEFYEVTVVRDPDSNLPQLLGLTINGQQLQSKNFAPGSYVTIRVHPEGYSEAVREFSVYSHTTLIVTDDESKQGDNYIYVRQGSNYTYVFHTENTQINLNSNDTSLQIPVTSTKDGAFIGYTARTLNNANWITGINVPVDSNTSLTITLTANNTNSARNETIILKQNETNSVIQIYITQAAPNSGEGGNNGGSGDSGSGSGGNEPDPGNENNNPVYVFRTNNLSGSIDAAANLSSAHDIVSTKNGNFQPFSLTSKPNWVNVSISGNTVTISADKNRITTARNGNVVLTQSESNNTITIQVTQAGLNPSPVGFEFAAMIIDNNGVETEQSLSDRITLNSNDLYKVLAPIFKSNGSLSQDTVTITSAGYAPNAANTDKFNINLSSTGLQIAPVANLSESVTTSYEIFVSYNEYSEHYIFEIAYNA